MESSLQQYLRKKIQTRNRIGFEFRFEYNTGYRLFRVHIYEDFYLASRIFGF